MKQRVHNVTPKVERALKVEVDILSIPSPTRKYSYLNNRAQYFADKRKKPPKYKTISYED